MPTPIPVVSTSFLSQIYFPSSPCLRSLTFFVWWYQNLWCILIGCFLEILRSFRYYLGWKRTFQVLLYKVYFYSLVFNSSGLRWIFYSFSYSLSYCKGVSYVSNLSARVSSPVLKKFCPNFRNSFSILCTFLVSIFLCFHTNLSCSLIFIFLKWSFYFHFGLPLVLTYLCCMLRNLLYLSFVPLYKNVTYFSIVLKLSQSITSIRFF